MTYSVFQPCLQGIKKIMSTQIRFLFSEPSVLFLKRVMFCKNKCAHVYTQLHMLHNQFHGLMVMLLFYTQFFFAIFLPSSQNEKNLAQFFICKSMYIFLARSQKKSRTILHCITKGPRLQKPTPYPPLHGSK